MPQFNKNVPTKFSEETEKWLKDYAMAADKKVSEVVREAVSEYRKSKSGNAHRPQRSVQLV
jgi:hemerythrin